MQRLALRVGLTHSQFLSWTPAELIEFVDARNYRELWRYKEQALFFAWQTAKIHAAVLGPWSKSRIDVSLTQRQYFEELTGEKPKGRTIEDLDPMELEILEESRERARLSKMNGNGSN